MIAALHRAIAFVEVDNIAVLVSEDLNFDVLSSLNVAFEKNCGVSAGVLGFFLGLGKACLQLNDRAAAKAWFEKALELPANTVDDEQSITEARKLLNERR